MYACLGFTRVKTDISKYPDKQRKEQKYRRAPNTKGAKSMLCATYTNLYSTKQNKTTKTKNVTINQDFSTSWVTQTHAHTLCQSFGIGCHYAQHLKMPSGQ